MTKLQQLEAKIRELCPELMELSRNFSYEIKRRGRSVVKRILDHPTSYECLCGCNRGKLTTQAFTSFRCGLCRKRKIWPNGLRPKWCIECSKARNVCPHCRSKITIIGHPITLEHVLKSLQRPYTLYCNIDRSASVLLVCDDIRTIWQLGKPLHEQSEETIEFLHNLISP